MKRLMVFALMCGLGLLAIAEAKEVPAPVRPAPAVVAPAPVVRPAPVVAPAPAVVAPVAAERDIRVGGEIRVRYLNWTHMLFPAGIGNEGWTEARIRLLLEAGLAQDVKLVLRLSSDRNWGAHAKHALGYHKHPVLLDWAYVTIPNVAGQPADLTIGRQPIVLGDKMQIADDFDAIRLSFPFEPVVVNAFFAKAADFDRADPATVTPDDDLIGFHVVYKHPEPAITANMGYYELIRRVAPKERVRSIAISGSGNILGLVGVGGRIGDLGLIVDGGIIHQSGSVGAAKIDAGALHLGVGAVTGVGKVRLNYASLSGDVTPGGPREFRPMFEDVEFGEIIEELPGLDTNARFLGLSLKTMPIPGVGVRVGYVDAKRHRVGPGVAKKLGTELNLGVTYDLTKDVQLGFVMARFKPGGWWRAPNPVMTKTATLMGFGAELKF